ncbi:hypothetical protein P7C73_g2350, partial [Tremellales sp. Uapishka_1]
MSTYSTLELSDGTVIPRIGFGIGNDVPLLAYFNSRPLSAVGTAHYRADCTAFVVKALETGYRYLDAADMYANSESIGSALKEWKGDRKDLFLLTKCGREEVEYTDPRKKLVQLLKEMNVEYVDLYLLHSPLLFGKSPSAINDAWKIMEELKAEGLTKSIGVSNFRDEDLQAIKATWTTPPVVNQIELHPYNIHEANMQRLLETCRANKITIEAYGPLTPLIRSPGGPIDPIVKAIAAEKGITEGQVLLSWAAQVVDGVVVTTSANPGRMKEQLQAIEQGPLLSPEQVNEITEKGRGRSHRHFMLPVWAAAKP